MDRPRKATRFQIHLSTALLLTLASGILVGINMRMERVQFYRNDTGLSPITLGEARAVQTKQDARDDESALILFMCGKSHGWPWAAFEKVHTCYFLGEELREDRTFFVLRGWNFKGVLLDAGCALLILAVLGILVEKVFPKPKPR